jgi:outer membrane protein assembly factor BamB
MNLYTISVDARKLYALDLDDLESKGKPQPQWEYPPDEDLDAIYSTPVFKGGLLYLGTYKGKVLALDTRILTPRWQRNLKGDIVGGGVVSDDTLFIGSGERLYALDVLSGDCEWYFETEGEVWSTPQISGDMIYFGSLDHRFYALDKYTGQKRWDFESGGAIASTAEVDKEKVYVGSLDGKFYALDKYTGQKRWDFKAEDWFWAKPLLVEGTIYVGSLDGKFYALDKYTGQKRWDFEAGSPMRSCAAAMGDSLIIFTDSGDMYILDPKTGTESSQRDSLGSSILSDPTYLDEDKDGLYDRFYITTQDGTTHVVGEGGEHHLVIR